MNGKFENGNNVLHFTYFETKGELKINIKGKEETYKTKNGCVFMKDRKKLRFVPSIERFLTVKRETRIPKKIWQTDKKLPRPGGDLDLVTKRWRELNPDWEYNFISDSEALDFCEKHFKPNVANAIRVLVPGAYKADLIRACYLYIEGGVYADIKLKPLYPLDQILDRDLVLVKDKWDNGVWNGFVATAPRNNYFLTVIKRIVGNVMNLRRGKNCLDITGPKVWESVYLSYFKEEKKLEIGLYHGKRIIFHQVESLMGKKKFLSMYSNGPHIIEWKADYEGRQNYYHNWKKENVYDKELWRKYFAK